ncbi:MAG: hypothetical protein JWP61_1161 [Friedmanniella sp.]|nr:hypothetical protein [Friedmanniella sp.]
MPRPHRSIGLTRLIGLGLLVVLVVAMVANTRFLTPAELAAARPKPFDAAETAGQLFAQAKKELPGRANKLGDVLNALQTDPKAAAQKYKAVSPADNAYVFPVTTTATVTEASDANLRLKVDGVSSETPVILPLTTAVNGTLLRDAMGFKFADAPGQTDYQYVGDELKKLILADLDASIKDPQSLKGKKVKVVGVINVLDASSPQPRAKPVNVQPLSVEAAS